MNIEIKTEGIEDWGKDKEKTLLNFFTRVGVDGQQLIYADAKSMEASGNLARSVTYLPSMTQVIIKATANYATYALETGTPPRTNVSTMAIAQWLKQKGISGNAFLIARKINKEGSKTYRRGGRGGVTKVFNQLKDVIVPNYISQIQEAYAN